MASLLDITEDMSALDALLTENGGDISDPAVMDAVDRWFAENESNLRLKADGYAAFIQEQKLLAESRKSEADRMAAKAKRNQATADFMAGRLKATMEQLGLPKIETARFTIAVQGNGGKQPVDVFGAIDQLPEWAKRAKTIIEPDKDKIRERLEAGDTLEFAVLQPRGTRLAIR
jgi:hypothetical protein